MSKSSGFISIVLIFLSFQTQAYVGSVSAATGESGRAAVEASESPFGNPAGLAFLSGYYFSAGFGASRQTAMGTAQDLAVSLTDNMKETVLPTSLSYVQRTTLPSGAAEEVFQRNFKLSFGNFLRDGLGFGLAVNHEDDRLPSEHFSQTNIQTGFLWAPNKNFGAALVFDNILPGSGGVPEAYRLKSTTAIGGSYNYKRFVRLKADLISDSGNSWSRPTLAAGMESYMNRWLVLRWGVGRNNETESNLYTAGLGFIGPKFGIHYAFQNSPQNESLTRHSVDLAVPIW
jgi:hypothetical protein